MGHRHIKKISEMQDELNSTYLILIGKSVFHIYSLPQLEGEEKLVRVSTGIMEFLGPSGSRKYAELWRWTKVQD